jgi:enamine deaminase RidA (YjgF/YER057c/UK114 family)
MQASTFEAQAPPGPRSKLAALGLTLPTVAPSVATYVPALRTGSFVFSSGQLPFVDGTLSATGKVGSEISVDEAIRLAQVCVLNALAAVDAVVGLEAIARVIRVGGFVASAPGFTGQADVLNGASNLLGEIFEAEGTHVRSAVGVAVLPLDAPVEVEILVELVT